MKLKSFFGACVALGAMALMAVGVQAATYSIGSVSGSAGGEVTVPVQITSDADETVPVNAYAMAFTYNPQQATPVVAGKDATEADCYATDGTLFNSDNSILVSDVISVSDTESKLIVAWAAPTAVSVAANTTETLASVTFDIADTATSSIPLTITTATVASDANTVADVDDTKLAQGEINLANFLRGDANGDDTVDARDSALILQSLVNLGTIEDVNKERADANADGTIDARDSALILQYLVNLGVIPD